MTTVNMANKFSDDQIDILINMWQSEPALWNINLLIYSNDDARKAALARISSQLNIDSYFAWRNISALSEGISMKYETDRQPDKQTTRKHYGF